VGEEKRNVPRLALSIGEAAEALSVSRDFFDQHVRHELRLIRRGRKAAGGRGTHLRAVHRCLSPVDIAGQRRVLLKPAFQFPNRHEN
jgi:hypothetical protein